MRSRWFVTLGVLVNAEAAMDFSSLSWIPMLVVGVFVLVIGMMLVSILQGFTTWFSNNGQPVETRRVRIVTKRQHVSGGGGDFSASTSYYATFEDLETGDRQEFPLESELYSGIADGDLGRLTHQGTRFKGFERERHRVPEVRSGPEPAPREEVSTQPDRTCAYCLGKVPANLSKCPTCGASEFVP